MVGRYPFAVATGLGLNAFVRRTAIAALFVVYFGIDPIKRALG